MVSVLGTPIAPTRKMARRAQTKARCQGRIGQAEGDIEKRFLDAHRQRAVRGLTERDR
jgi:hypothetical protein